MIIKKFKSFNYLSINLKEFEKISKRGFIPTIRSYINEKEILLDEVFDAPMFLYYTNNKEIKKMYKKYEFVDLDNLDNFNKYEKTT